ncbi:MAG: cyclic nucleotide-binding domain-containing protein [FCB group bacterium]|nr:cyclic nucleotide-binding domain-containing protein [FCB group bacterium]
MEIHENPELSELKNLDFFSRIPENELLSITGVTQIRNYFKDETIISEEAAGDFLFILHSGRVNIVKKSNNGDYELVNVIDRPGEFFGEMSLLDDSPRSAGAVAAEDSLLYVIPKESFLTLLNRFPHLAMHLAVSIGNFLRKTDTTLLNQLKRKNAELVRANEELRLAQQELIRRERLSAVGKLASSIIHDIKNPMTAIQGYAQMMHDSEMPHDKVAQYSEIIVHEVDRFITMARDVLNFARGDIELVKDTMEIKDLVESIVSSMSSTFDAKGLKLDANVNYLCAVEMDFPKLLRAFENICFNSIDALDEGGALKIRTESTEKGVHIHFEDDGCGMTDSVKSRIFEEFFTHNKSHGTGLGLAITKSVILEHNGTIEVRSELDQGTCFKIFLPSAG